MSPLRTKSLGVSWSLGLLGRLGYDLVCTVAVLFDHDRVVAKPGKNRFQSTDQPLSSLLTTNSQRHVSIQRRFRGQIRRSVASSPSLNRSKSPAQMPPRGRESAADAAPKNLSAPRNCRAPLHLPSSWRGNPSHLSPPSNAKKPRPQRSSVSSVTVRPWQTQASLRSPSLLLLAAVRAALWSPVPVRLLGGLGTRDHPFIPAVPPLVFAVRP